MFFKKLLHWISRKSEKMGWSLKPGHGYMTGWSQNKVFFFYTVKNTKNCNRPVGQLCGQGHRKQVTTEHYGTGMSKQNTVHYSCSYFYIMLHTSITFIGYRYILYIWNMMQCSPVPAQTHCKMCWLPSHSRFVHCRQCSNPTHITQYKNAVIFTHAVSHTDFYMQFLHGSTSAPFRWWQKVCSVQPYQ